MDQVRFCGTCASFPLHERGEVELIGLSMHISVFMSSTSPTDLDREVGECSVDLEKSWLMGTAGHTTWLRLVSGAGGSAGRVKVLILPEFGRGTMLQGGDSMLRSRNETRLQDTLLNLSEVCKNNVSNRGKEHRLKRDACFHSLALANTLCFRADI